MSPNPVAQQGSGTMTVTDPGVPNIPSSGLTTITTYTSTTSISPLTIIIPIVCAAVLILAGLTFCLVRRRRMRRQREIAHSGKSAYEAVIRGYDPVTAPPAYAGAGGQGFGGA